MRDNLATAVAMTSGEGACIRERSLGPVDSNVFPS